MDKVSFNPHDGWNIERRVKLQILYRRTKPKKNWRLRDESRIRKLVEKWYN